MGWKRFRSVVSRDVRFYWAQAERCRDLARLTDEVCRRLTDMARECDDRAREAEKLAEPSRRETEPLPVPQPKQTIEPLTLSIKDASRLLGLGRTTIYRLIADRELEVIKIGHRTLVKTASLQRLVANRE
ncbi:MAG TPA: helix-turn-helix domain-containing protein [Sphingomicrobium sp.]|nr:helix-turn-helix domain-containing protein [Sphingomicrobium sp.]